MGKVENKLCWVTWKRLFSDTVTFTSCVENGSNGLTRLSFTHSPFRPKVDATCVSETLWVFFWPQTTASEQTFSHKHREVFIQFAGISDSARYAILWWRHKRVTRINRKYLVWKQGKNILSQVCAILLYSVWRYMHRTPNYNMYMNQ